MKGWAIKRNIVAYKIGAIMYTKCFVLSVKLNILVGKFILLPSIANVNPNIPPTNNDTLAFLYFFL